MILHDGTRVNLPWALTYKSSEVKLPFKKLLPFACICIYYASISGIYVFIWFEISSSIGPFSMSTQNSIAMTVTVYCPNITTNTNIIGYIPWYIMLYFKYRIYQKMFREQLKKPENRKQFNWMEQYWDEIIKSEKLLNRNHFGKWRNSKNSPLLSRYFRARFRLRSISGQKWELYCSSVHFRIELKLWTWSFV